MATGPLWSVPGHIPVLSQRPKQLAGSPRVVLPGKAAAPRDPSRAASSLPHHSEGLQAGLRGPGAPWPLRLSVPVCRMGRHRGTSAPRSYSEQPSPLTLAGCPAERGLAGESGQQRPLTRSSLPSCPGVLFPLAPDPLEEPSETVRREPRRPERPTMCTNPEGCAALPFGPPDSPTLPRHSRRARAPPAPPRPKCALRRQRPASLRRRRMRGLGGVGGRVRRIRCGVQKHPSVPNPLRPLLGFGVPCVAPRRESESKAGSEGVAPLGMARHRLSCPGFLIHRTSTHGTPSGRPLAGVAPPNLVLNEVS